MIIAKNLMHEPITILRDSSLSDAIKKLLYYNISRLIVRKDLKLVGILTEKDIGNFLFKDTSAASLEQIPIDKIMKPIIFIDGTASVQDCARTMISNGISSLVVGTSEKAEGILTKTDIVANYAESHVGENKVVQIKNPGYVSVSTESSLSEAIQKMFENNISRIIVTNQNKKPIGIITFRDFFGISLQLASEQDVTESAALSGQIRKGFLSDVGFGGISLARDIMTRKILSVSPDDDLSYACKLMITNQINGLAVVDKEGKTGIISKTDIVQFLAGYIGIRGLVLKKKVLQ
ncbi:MAG: Signal transduction protein [Nitrosopumilales archaeon]|nr:MAG: Signal transduction protein [Nitrosopumilales archaeon]